MTGTVPTNTCYKTTLAIFLSHHYTQKYGLLNFLVWLIYSLLLLWCVKIDKSYFLVTITFLTSQLACQTSLSKELFVVVRKVVMEFVGSVEWWLVLLWLM